MNKLLIIFVIVSLAITAKADSMDAFNDCVKDKCGSDSSCTNTQTTAASCVSGCQSKATNDEISKCMVNCGISMTPDQQNIFNDCTKGLSNANIVSFSLLIIFVFFLIL